jgi:hypothetical protein
MSYDIHFRRVLFLSKAPPDNQENAALSSPNDRATDNIIGSIITQNKGGRKKLVSDAIIEKITKINHEKNLAGDSMSSRAIIKLIEKKDS